MFETNNNEPRFASGRRKRLVLNRLEQFRGKTEGKVVEFGHVVLSDRHILILGLIEDFAPFSDWMQAVHCSLVATINKQEKRTGHLGRRRPTTHPAEQDECLLKMLFAIDYLPVKVGEVESPEQVTYSSYHFFARGKELPWTKEITRPAVYQRLGNTDLERQKAYRELGRKFYQEGILDEYMDEMLKGRPVGTEKYRRARSKFLAEVSRKERLMRAAGWVFAESFGVAYQRSPLRILKWFDAIETLVREVVAPGPDPPRPLR